MPSIAIRDADPSDFDAICALNLSEVHHTSPMDAARLSQLHRIAAYHEVACVDGRIAAFVLAMRHDAPYENANFAWFVGRYPKFIYVDRIVVSAQARGLRLGSRLYEDLFDRARAEGIPKVTCEYNLVPPNEPSRRFHDGHGFREVGTQWLAGGTKRVSLQAADLDRDPVIRSAEEPP